MNSRLFTIALCIGAARGLAAQHVSPVAVHHEEATVTALPSQSSLAASKGVDDGLGPLYIAVGALVGAGTATYVIFHGVHWNNDGMIIPIAPFAEIAGAGILGGILGWAIHDGKQS